MPQLLQKNCFATVSEEGESYSKFDQSNIKSSIFGTFNFSMHFLDEEGQKKIALYYIYCCIKVLRVKDFVRHIYAFITTEQHACKHVGLGRVYIFLPGSGFGPLFLARFGSGKLKFFFGSIRV